MSDQTQLVRQWILLRTLASRRLGVTVKELAEELNVSEKTIRRDFGVFQQVGFPLQDESEEFGRKRWKIEVVRDTPNLVFTYDEAMALYIARRLTEPLAGTPFGIAAHRAFRKIRAMLSEQAASYVDRFAALFYETTIGISDYHDKSEVIDQIFMAIEEHKNLFITYQSLQATEPVSYDVQPYGLIRHRGSLYLVGRSLEHNEIRHWKIDRMASAEKTKIPFTPPEDFDLEEHLKGSFGIYYGDEPTKVRVRFAKTVARYVTEKKWHHSQKLREQRTGSVLAEFQLDSLVEFKSWILSFGRYAEVLEPDSLREELAAEVAAMAEAYGLLPGQAERAASRRQPRE